MLWMRFDLESKPVSYPATRVEPQWIESLLSIAKAWIEHQRLEAKPTGPRCLSQVELRSSPGSERSFALGLDRRKSSGEREPMRAPQDVCSWVRARARPDGRMRG